MVLLNKTELITRLHVNSAENKNYILLLFFFNFCISVYMYILYIKYRTTSHNKTINMSL